MVFAPYWPGGTLDDLEQEVLKHLGNPSTASKQFQGLLEDMLFLAWRRENRQRVLLFLGKQLEFCSKTQLKEAARIICEQLCLVSWASSMVDVEYYSCWVLLGFVGWLGGWVSFLSWRKVILVNASGSSGGSDLCHQQSWFGLVPLPRGLRDMKTSKEAKMAR